MADKFTLSDFGGAEIVLNTATHNSKVARAMDDGRIVEGIARSVGYENGNFAQGEDVRDLFLRVTSTQTGFDYFWPVRDLMREARQGLFAPRR